MAKLLSLALSLLILGQAYWVRRRVGTWLCPGALFGLFWFGYSFFPLAVLYWVPANPWSIAFILLCATAFSIGSLPFDWNLAFAENALKGDGAGLAYDTPLIRNAFYLATLGSVTLAVLNLLQQGFSLHALVFDLKASAAAYAALLYAETLTDSMYDRVSTVLAYLGPALGGLLLPSTRTRAGKARIVALSLLPPTIVALTQTSKGLLFLCVALFVAGLLAVRIEEGKLGLFDAAIVRPVLLSFSLLVPIVVSAFLLRGLGDIEDDGLLLSTLGSYLASYSFGHLYAFSDWFSYTFGGHSVLAYGYEGITFGFYTFSSLFRMMGSEKAVPLGVFDDYYTYGEGLTTNIFTMFRGLILDFGLVGAVLFMLVVGLLFHWALRSLLTSRRPAFSVAVFVFMVGFFYNSYIISLLGWNRTYAAFAMLWAILQINRWTTDAEHAPDLAPRATGPDPSP
jgi:oligosaccharide repeat unit polymerase